MNPSMFKSQDEYHLIKLKNNEQQNEFNESHNLTEENHYDWRKKRVEERNSFMQFKNGNQGNVPIFIQKGFGIERSKSINVFRHWDQSNEFNNLYQKIEPV